MEYLLSGLSIPEMRACSHNYGFVKAPDLKCLTIALILCMLLNSGMMRRNVLCGITI